MRTLISSGRALSLEDETDKISDNLNLDNVRSTVGDKKLSSSLTLLQNSDRLKDTYSILNTAIRKLKSETSTDRTKKKQLEILKKTVLPMLLIVSNDLVESSKMVAPIAGTRYAHARHEVDRRKSTDTNVFLAGQISSNLISILFRYFKKKKISFHVFSFPI